MPGGNRHGDAGRHQHPAAPRRQHRILAGVEVEAGITGVGVGRQWQTVIEPDDVDGETWIGPVDGRVHGDRA